MAGKVVRVRRRERLGWAQRLYLPMILAGLGASVAVLVRNGIAQLCAQTPQARAPVEAPRGAPVLVRDAGGAHGCVACGLCAFACPTDCIEVERDGDADRPQRFALDLSRCMYCGACEEACPENAIALRGSATVARADASELRLDLLGSA